MIARGRGHAVVASRAQKKEQQMAAALQKLQAECPIFGGSLRAHSLTAPHVCRVLCHVLPAALLQAYVDWQS